MDPGLLNRRIRWGKVPDTYISRIRIMKPISKNLKRNILNAAIVFGILIVMDYRFTGNVVHEVFSVIVVLLFVFHNVLNRYWYKMIGKGSASLLRKLKTTVVLLLLITMLVATVSGVLISKTLFESISVSGQLWVHELHTVSSYLGFIFGGIHLGFHWRSLGNRLFRRLKTQIENIWAVILIRSMAVLIAGYGCYVSFQRQIDANLLLQPTYTSWGIKLSPMDFLLDHLAIMIFYVFMTHYLILIIMIRRNIMKRYLLFSFVLLWAFSGCLFAETDNRRLRIKIATNGLTLNGYLNNSATARHLVEKLPMTLSMRNLYAREMVYRFPYSLPTDNVSLTGYKVGEIIYWPPGNSFVIMYAQDGERFSMQKVGFIESDRRFFKEVEITDVTFELIKEN